MRKSFIITNLRDLSKTQEERSNFRIDKQMKRILKNCRRKRREPYAIAYTPHLRSEYDSMRAASSQIPR